MKTKHLFTLIAFFLISNIFSQANLNDIKYVIVPNKFDFLKSADKYQLNSLTKFLFEKEQFNVLFNDENFPTELGENRCLALYSNVIENNSLLRTKLIVELKDCNNKVVFQSKEGISKIKEYSKAYHEALRDAFQSFKTLNYNYKPKQVTQEVVEEEIKKTPVVETPVLKETSNKGIVNAQKKEIVESQINEIPIEVESIRKEFMSKNPIADIIDMELIAEKFDLGFNVFDSKSNRVMVLLMTGSDDVYIVKDYNAIVSKNKNGFWVYSENDGTNFLVKSIKIKF